MNEIIRADVIDLAEEDAGLFTLEVKLEKDGLKEKRVYSGYLIADMLLKINHLKEEYGKNISLDLIDNLTGEILYGQYEELGGRNIYGAIVQF